jgi:hypothetical protein
MRPPGMPGGIKEVIETSDVPTQTIAKLLPYEARPGATLGRRALHRAFQQPRLEHLYLSYRVMVHWDNLGSSRTR